MNLHVFLCWGHAINFCSLLILPRVPLKQTSIDRNYIQQRLSLEVLSFMRGLQLAWWKNQNYSPMKEESGQGHRSVRMLQCSYSGLANVWVASRVHRDLCIYVLTNEEAVEKRRNYWGGGFQE